MRFWQIILKSLRQHWLSTGLAILSIACGVALLIAVVSLREQAHRNFTQEGLGVDAVLGPKGSPLQIILNSLYHLEEMPGKLPWPYYEKVLQNPVVESGIPFVTGHSYAGFRVNAIDDRFFSEFTYLPGKHFTFATTAGGQGRRFQTGDEAVAGWAAAKALNVHLGDTFSPVCGVHSGDPEHVEDRIRFVGIMAPTGTPHDRAIYIPLKTFYGLEGHGAAVAAMADDVSHREISGAYLTIRRIRGGALHPGIQDLKYGVNQSAIAQLVIPNEVLPRLMEIIGWADRVLIAMAVLVTLMAAMFLFVSLLSALRERRRDLALMRSLGANRRTVFGLILVESVFMATAGTVLGLALGHGLVAISSRYIHVETGLQFSASHFSTADLWMPLVMIAIGLAAGILPAVQAYRLGVLQNLKMIS
jgi:putative ABC transport system permease protein